MFDSVPSWFQVFAVLVAPVLTLVGVGYGVRLSRKVEQRQWLRDSRLDSYTRYLRACNNYDVAWHQLEASIAAGQRADQVTAREAAMRAIERVISRQEPVLLLATPDVRQACVGVTSAVFARNDQARMLLERQPSAAASNNGPDLRRAIDAFREAVRTELEPERSPRGHRPARLPAFRARNPRS